MSFSAVALRLYIQASKDRKRYGGMHDRVSVRSSHVATLQCFKTVNGTNADFIQIWREYPRLAGDESPLTLVPLLNII